jgi:hypothetical protein
MLGAQGLDFVAWNITHLQKPVITGGHERGEWDAEGSAVYSPLQTSVVLLAPSAAIKAQKVTNFAQQLFSCRS